MTIKWDKRFLEMAQVVAQWSKDTRGVGCVLVDDDKTILSTGFNGFPRGVLDDGRLLNKVEKLKIVVHAEANAVAAAARHGHAIKGSTAYITRRPCTQCAALLIQAGVKRVMSIQADEGSWAENMECAVRLLLEAGVRFELGSGGSE
jgi:dCMP deaminase